MSQTDDVAGGIRCMSCLSLLASDTGEVCSCGHPVFCRDCWIRLPAKDRKAGAPYFAPKTGEVATG